MSSKQWNTTIARAGLRPRQVEQVRQRHPAPLADHAPAFDAVVAGDLGARRQRAQCVERKFQRSLHQPADLQPVAAEAIGLEREVFRRLRIGRAVGAEHRRDHRLRDIRPPADHRSARAARAWLSGSASAEHVDEAFALSTTHRSRRAGRHRRRPWRRAAGAGARDEACAHRSCSVHGCLLRPTG